MTSGGKSYNSNRPYHAPISSPYGSHSYDPNGNLTQIVTGTLTVASFAWNSENRLSSATKNGVSESYAYDVDGNRIRETIGITTTRIFFPGVYEEEQVSTAIPTPIKHYSFNGMTIAVRRGGTLRYTHTDHLGSSSGQTDTAGQAIAASYLRYYAYGGLRSGSLSASTTDRTFTGQKADGTGLMYYNARYYDPALGTFLSPDTLVPDAGAVIDYNRFAYARNNPLKYSDPSGHEPQCDVGESSCDQQWVLWRQYEQVQDNWSSWDDFLAGYGSYQNYLASPDSYYADWLMRAGLAEGDRESAVVRLALAEGYGESVLREPAPSFFDYDFPREVAFELSDSGSSLAGVSPMGAVVVGKAQITSDPTHAARSNAVRDRLLGQPDVAEIHLNRQLRSVTDGRVSSQLRPDVAVKYTDGSYELYEHVSPSQTVASQKYKVNLMNQMLKWAGFLVRDGVVD